MQDHEERKTKRGGAARRHKEVIMLAVEERREEAAYIIAEGVVRLLANQNDDIRLMPVVEDETSTHLDGGRRCSHLRLVTKPDNKGGA